MYTPEQAVELAVPRHKGTSHLLLCKLAGALWAFEETTGTTIAEGELRGIFRMWYAKAKPFLDEEQTEDEYFLEFMDAWRNVDHPLAESQVDMAWKRAQTAPVPPEAQAADLTSPNLCRLISFCREMQLLSGGEPFFLSPYCVMKLFGQRTHSTAAKWLGGLCSLNILTLVERGDFALRRAASYRFNFKVNPEAATEAATAVHGD